MIFIGSSRIVFWLLMDKLPSLYQLLSGNKGRNFGNGRNNSARGLKSTGHGGGIQRTRGMALQWRAETGISCGHQALKIGI
ncbi:hypothetical protein HMP0721_0255 [Pseudoramibacter alactolyticus ATCC 23263]|uniref:Uncharacterized protein n=2 Tax=Pseudoramibacter TaxID=113286 RepID=E6ME22_9FIRM|nr:hypothetical protein [Pseudoramibacter alactolyticus]EFV02781.1 hypothetical protein HMP0721_0255 [Pseudoramibacter alactolyticus ATCC 23263]